MYRVYYNRRAEAPFIWSIDAGTLETEIKVKSVQFHKVVAETGENTAIRVNDPDNPKVFFIVRYATLTIKDGHACFFADPNWRKPKLNADAK